MRERIVVHTGWPGSEGRMRITVHEHEGQGPVVPMRESERGRIEMNKSTARVLADILDGSFDCHPENAHLRVDLFWMGLQWFVVMATLMQQGVGPLFQVRARWGVKVHTPLAVSFRDGDI